MKDYDLILKDFKHDRLKAFNLLCKVLGEKHKIDYFPTYFTIRVHEYIDKVIESIERLGFSGYDGLFNRKGYGCLDIFQLLNFSEIVVKFGLKFKATTFMDEDQLKQILKHKSEKEIINFFRSKKFFYMFKELNNSNLYFYNSIDNIYCAIFMLGESINSVKIKNFPALNPPNVLGMAYTYEKRLREDN